MYLPTCFFGYGNRYDQTGCHAEKPTAGGVAAGDGWVAFGAAQAGVKRGVSKRAKGQSAACQRCVVTAVRHAS